jgi:hypothetical protein
VPASGLCVLDSTELVYRGILEGVLVLLCQGGSILPVSCIGLVECLMDLIILLGLSLSVADLMSGGQNVCDTSKLGCEVVDCLVDLNRRIKGYW